jgi:RNA polymerase sigma-70 factor (ECF subfamily)
LQEKDGINCNFAAVLVTQIGDGKLGDGSPPPEDAAPSPERAALQRPARRLRRFARSPQAGEAPLEVSSGEALEELRAGCFRTRRTLDADAEAGLAISLAKDGDELGFRYLYLHYADNIYSYVRAILHDEHEAEDVTQLVFMKLLTAIEGYEPRGIPFSAWLLRIARNAAIDQLRRNRPVVSEEVRGTEHELDEIAQDRRWSLTNALADLPEDQRRVVVLRHVVGLTPPEIARRMGKTEGSVHALHHRGRKTLQAHLVRAGSAPAHAEGD